MPAAGTGAAAGCDARDRNKQADNDAPKHEIHGAERSRDPMSGYAGADAMRSDAKTDEADVDRVHAEEAKDSMSGYASADSLDADEK